MSELDDNTIRTKVYDIDEDKPAQTIVTNEQEEPKQLVVHDKNKEIWERNYVYPMLAEDMKKIKKEYGKEGFEKLFHRFKKMSDASIPVKKVITAIVRIRTLANKEQSLGEYIFYLANLYGYQKHFNPENGEITEFQSVKLLNVPFGYDKKLNMMPNYVNNIFKGYKSTGEYNFFTNKFVPNESIDKILENSDMMEGINVRYSFKDMGKDYGGYTREELSTLRSDRLRSRNEKKEMGSDIRPEDSMSIVTNEYEPEVSRSGKRK